MERGRLVAENALMIEKSCLEAYNWMRLVGILVRNMPQTSKKESGGAYIEKFSVQKIKNRHKQTQGGSGYEGNQES